MESIGYLIDEFTRAVRSPTLNNHHCENLIKQLKVYFSQFDLMDPHIDNNYRLMTRDFEEDLIHYSIGTQKFSDFENAYHRWRSLNEDFEAYIGKSTKTEECLALYLLYLLSISKISEFHVTLERLSDEEKKNKLIDFAIKLEESFMVGNYNEVLKSQNNAPLDCFKVFLDRIIETIRYEIARSVEKSFEFLTYEYALTLFYCDNHNELCKLIEAQKVAAKKNGTMWEEVEEKNGIRFVPIESDRSKFDALTSANDILQYADELEKIVQKLNQFIQRLLS